MGNKAGSTFLKHNVIFWTASLGVSFLNYIYYPILGRIMNPVNFGETQTIISFLTQTAVFLQVLSLVSIGIMTKYEDADKRERIGNELSRLTLIISVLLLIVTILLSPLLKGFFHFGSIIPFFALAICILINVPLSFANAQLQGTKRFWKLSIGNVLGSISKIVFSSLLVIIGFKTIGAIGGLIVSSLVSLIYALSMGKGIRTFVKLHMTPRLPDYKLVKQELPYAMMVFITSLTTNLLLSFDILVVKHYFSPKQAGLYTGISIISNIVYFITGPFASVLIPSLKPYGNHANNLKLLKRTLSLSLVVGGAATVVFCIAPHLVVSILLGHKYVVYASYLRGLSIALFMMSIANILIYYHIGLRHFLVAPVVAVGLVTTLTLLYKNHASMNFVVEDLVIGAVALLVLLVGLSARYEWSPA